MNTVNKAIKMLLHSYDLDFMIASDQQKILQ